MCNQAFQGEGIIRYTIAKNNCSQTLANENTLVHSHQLTLKPRIIQNFTNRQLAADSVEKLGWMREIMRLC
jgi:hypothetical protein